MKKFNLIAVSIMVISQFTIGVTVLGETSQNSHLETITEIEELVENNEQKESEELSETRIDSTEANTRGIDLDVKRNTVEIRMPIGSTEEAMKYAINSSITVRANGEILPYRAYDIEEIELSTGVDVISINEGATVNYTVVPTDTSTYNSKRMIDEPLDIYYGYSIVFGTEDEHRFAGAFSFVTGDGKDERQLVAVSGESDDNNVIDSSYGNNPYYKLDIIRGDQSEFYFDLEDDTEADVSFTVKGNERKQDALKRWDNDIEINEGDIIRTWTAEPDYNQFYSIYSKDDTRVKSNGYTYYYVSGSSLRKFYFPEMEIEERKISQTASDQYLDKTIEKSFGWYNPNIRELEMIDYPDRSRLGKTTGTIQIVEYVFGLGYYTHTLEDIPFEIIESRVTADMEDEVNLPVGTDLDLINPHSFIEAVYEDGEEMDIDDYDIFILDDYDSSTVGNTDNVMVEIVSKDDDAQTYADEIDINFVWGNSIGNKATDGKNYEASISMLEGKKKQPYLVANNGTGLATASTLTTNPKIKVFEDSDINGAKFSVDSLVDKRANSTRDHFQSKFEDYGDFKYGDVLVYENAKNTDKSNILVSRDEEMVSEVKGFSKGYYELTSEGFYLLKLNQLEVSDKTIELSVDEDMSDVSEKLIDAIIIPDSVKSDNRKLRFELDESSVDVKTEGKNRKATVLVYEELQTETKEFMTSYEVPYEVKQGISVDLKENVIPVGTPFENINPNDYVKSVTSNGNKLDPKEYSVSIDKNVNTNLVSKQATKVTIKVGSNEIVETTNTNVIWGDTIGSSKDGSDKEKTDVSISMLHDGVTPKLVANEGVGFGKNASSLIYINVYRESTESNDNKVFYSQHHYPKGEPKETMDLINNGGTYWNGGTKKLIGLKDTEFKYGDVLTYETRQHGNPETQEKSIRTFAARDEKLVKEAEGYDRVFYEMTKDGFRLMTLNQIVEDNKELKLDLTTGDTQEVVNKQIIEKIDFKDKDKKNFRFEAKDIDTKTPGTRKGNIQIIEKLATGGEFMTLFPISYEVEQGYSVELKENTIPVGTPMDAVKPNDYIKSVSDGAKELDPKNYKVTIENTINTNLVSSQDTTVKVKIDDKEITNKTKTNVIWANSIVSKAADASKIDSSVSLLDKAGKPYLRANEGTGLASMAQLNTRTDMRFYRQDENNQIHRSFYRTRDQSPQSLMNMWNEEFETFDLVYGDVMSYTVDRGTNVNVNENGKNTWVSRDEKLITETEGYDLAYYELTKDGYRLMQINQLEINSKMPVVSLNTTIEEMNKTAKDAMVIPKHIKNPKDYRFEYASVDTKTSGIKTTQMNVYEKLSTGGEFKTTYDVKYQVNPQLTETYSDVVGKKIKEPKMSNFDFGTKYTPTPENYITVGDEVYSYVGWLAAGKAPGKDKPNTSKVPSFDKEDTIQYVYEKADNLINMTIPTELLFGTDGNSKNITSKNYGIKNNSDKVSTEVSLSEFKKEKSDVTLLTSKDTDPSKTQQSARLNVTSNGTEVIKNLTESTKDQTITTLAPGQDTSIGLTGTYFGNLNESTIVHYQMQFKFKVIPN